MYDLCQLLYLLIFNILVLQVIHQVMKEASEAKKEEPGSPGLVEELVAAKDDRDQINRAVQSIGTRKFICFMCSVYT